MHYKSLIYNAFMAFYRAVTAIDLSQPCTSVTHMHRKSLKYIHFYMVTPPFVGGAGGVWVLADAHQKIF